MSTRARTHHKATDLFGGALFTAGVTLAALGGEALAQCNPQITDQILESPYRAPGSYNIQLFTAADLVGDKLHIIHFNYQSYSPYTTVESLVTFDVSNPNNATLLGHWEPGLKFGRGGPIVNGDTLYIGSAAVERQVDTYSIANPNNGVPLGSVAIAGRQSGLFEKHAGALLLTTFSPLELVAIGLSDPANPTILDSIPVPDGFFGLPVASDPVDGLVAAWGRSGDTLHLYDVSDPSNLIEISSTAISTSGNVEEIAIIGNTVALWRGGANLRLIDITDQLNPTLIGNFNPGVGTLGSLRGAGNLAFVSTDDQFNNNFTYPIDLSDPGSPVVGAAIPAPGSRRIVGTHVGDGLLVRWFDDSNFTPPVVGADLIDFSSCQTIPSILSLSPGGAMDEGGSLQLSAVAQDAAVFRWYHDGVEIADGALYSGSSTADLTIQGDPTVAGLYSVTASNTGGTDTAGPAIIAVRAAPAPATGACCLAGGVCAVTTEADCLASAGFYQGDDTDCVSVICSGCIGDINGDGATDVFDFADFAADFGCVTP